MRLIFRFYVRLGLYLYCHGIRTNDGKLKHVKGPLILACNHPNGFFDALVLILSVNDPVYFLGNGELTDKYLPAWLLKILRIIPVYLQKHISGSENIHATHIAFCMEILRKGGILCVFSEGVSEQCWHIRPIKKITARIANEALHDAQLQQDLRILPVGINYNSFQGILKSVSIQTGESFHPIDFFRGGREPENELKFGSFIFEKLAGCMLQTGMTIATTQFLVSNYPEKSIQQLKGINEKLETTGKADNIENLIKPYFINPENKRGLTDIFFIGTLAIPAALGWVLHIILYYPIKIIVKKKTEGSAYFDSVFFACLALTYPLYWILLNLFGLIYIGSFWVQALLFCMPILAWVTTIWIEKTQRIINVNRLPVSVRKILYDN